MSKEKVKIQELPKNGLRLEWWDVNQLPANPKNWRRHPKAQVDALRGVLAEVGWAGALLFNEANGRLVDGHLRKEVAKGQKVPVLIGNWTEAQEREILATLDPLGAMAQPDMDALVKLLAEVQSVNPAINALLEALANGETLPLKPGLIDDDEIPEHVETICKTGDLWQLGQHRLLCGDATKRADVERLMAGEKADILLTDPPYGVAYETAGKNPRWRKDSLPIANDNLGRNQKAFWIESLYHWPLEGDAYIFSPAGPPMIVMAEAIVANGIEQHQWLIWVKDRFTLGRSHYHYRHEHIFYGWKGKSSWQNRRDEVSIWEYPRPSRSPEHPTIKPVALLERALKNSSRMDDSVIDPFGGSGSTLIACEKLGRKCLMMEIEPYYCDVVIQRWQNFTGQLAVKL